MKTSSKITLRSLSCLLALLVVFSTTAFTPGSGDPYKTVTTSHIKVLGTSNMHDWTMDAQTFSCEANFTVNNGVLEGINSLNFTLPVSNLKGKENLLNSRAHKALDAEKHKTISFQLTKATVVPGQKIVIATGNLTISGVTKAITLKSTYVINADKTITFKGSESVKMSNHGVKAPSFMMGALKTGDEVKIDFVLKLKN